MRYLWAEVNGEMVDNSTSYVPMSTGDSLILIRKLQELGEIPEHPGDFPGSGGK